MCEREDGDHGMFIRIYIPRLCFIFGVRESGVETIYLRPKITRLRVYCSGNRPLRSPYLRKLALGSALEGRKSFSSRECNGFLVVNVMNVMNVKKI
jgi:hypothetical protein